MRDYFCGSLIEVGNDLGSAPHGWPISDRGAGTHDAMIRISTGLRDAVQPPRCATSLHITHSAY
jgi:hypothetical protein